MAIIIGNITTVNIGGVTDGFQSVQWSTQASPNRLWQLGKWNAYKTQVNITKQVSVTTYAGVLGTVGLTPSSSCADSNAKKNISIVANSCGAGGSQGLSENGMYLSSYSYNKSDPVSFGTESWSFQKWIAYTAGSADYISTPAPTLVLLGITEGQYSGDVTNMGVVLDSVGQVTGSQGSVSAGPGSQGQADDTIYGIATQVGGGTLQQAGKIGTSSATIPHTPLYV